jgi:hypothetical protein
VSEKTKKQEGTEEDRRTEYEALRAEILYSDQACMIIIGALLSGSVGVLTFAFDKNQPDVAAWLSPVWLIGYFYITEKRFVIETIAMYVREHVETQSTFGWENWLRSHREAFPRFFPYLIETIVSVIASVVIPLFITWRKGWHLTTLSVIASSVFVPIMLWVGYRNYSRYKGRAGKNVPKR